VVAGGCVCQKPRPLDLMRESLNVGRDGALITDPIGTDAIIGVTVGFFAGAVRRARRWSGPIAANISELLRSLDEPPLAELPFFVRC
jgi:hypothetical protein